MITIQRNEKNRNKTWISSESSLLSAAFQNPAQAFAQIAETGLLYSNRLLDRVKPLLFACLLDKVPWESMLGKKNFLWVRNNRDHQKAIESYDFCQLKPHLFSRRKELRGYPLIRRVGAISLCKFMTAPLALRGGR